MLSRIVSVDPQGGPWGLGEIVAELDLSPESWFFPCHFQDDQVMAGSLMAEGCGQLMQFYMLLMGLQTQTFDARFQPIRGLPQVVRCRGQVTPRHRKLIYRLEITDIGMHPRPFARANVDIISEGKIVVNFKDLGLQLVEKDLTLSPPAARDHREITQSVQAAAVVRRADLVADEAQITAFALGSHADCFGPEYRVFERMRAPRTPNGPLQLISRVVEIQGRRHEFRPGTSLVSEYDVPEYPWFCIENNYPTTPYSILMELGLQPCGFLSAWLGSMLIFPDQELFFRNLDGSGHLRRSVDLRGKTVTNRVTLVSSTSIQGVVIQKFTYALECDGEIVYDGDAVFGYFTAAALTNQAGLDNGRSTAAWHEQEQATRTLTRLRPEAFLRAAPGRVHARLAGGRLGFLDEVWVGPGGRYGAGYVFARRRINPEDWFYRSHFYEDPVMPGSLGIEAILEAMQAAALHSGLPNELANPHVVPLAPNRTVWKYRGQIVQATREMCLEVHLRPVQRADGRIVLLGDASLWKQDLRIYEVQGLGLEWRRG
jgi:3-hydroxymyristoyl/3-hydroxydecanoyl-(acyl carrier protein) dehydratase